MELVDWNEWMVKAARDAAENAGLKTVTWQKSIFPVRLGQLLRRIKVVRGLIRRTGGDAYLTLQGHISEYRMFPVSYVNEIIPYCYDCWPGRYDEWEAFFRRHKVRVAFFASRQNAERFGRRLPGTKCFWVPEGCPVHQYMPDKPLAARQHDLVEFGRVFERFHAPASVALREATMTHYAGTGRLTRAEFFQLLGNAKVSACFPRSMTHPELAGDVETMTLRYLEIMASGCLPLGTCPAELRDLFGYNPVVEVDWTRPGDQLVSLVHDIAEDQPLVDRNLQFVRQLGSWDARLTQMIGILGELGYEVPNADAAATMRQR